MVNLNYFDWAIENYSDVAVYQRVDVGRSSLRSDQGKKRVNYMTGEQQLTYPGGKPTERYGFTHG